MARLVLNSGPGKGSEFTLVEGLNRVGRAPSNEVRLDDPAISLEHGELWLMRERLLVRDLGSTNGTFLDGQRVQEAEVKSGQTLAFGAAELLVKEAPEPVVVVIRAPPPPAPPRFMADGTPCCRNHAPEAASFRCSKCGEQYCDQCVRAVGRRGGAILAFCPECDGPCVAILPGRTPVQRTSSSGWLAKLTQTLRLRR